MRRISLLIAAFFIFSSVAHASPGAFISSQKLLYVDGTAYGINYLTGGFSAPAEAFAKSPAARAEWERARSWQKWGAILNWGSLGVLLTYSLTTNLDSYEPSTGFALFFVPWFAGVLVTLKGQTLALKAINLYNGVPADRAHQPTNRFQYLSQGGDSKYPGLALSYDF